MFTAEAACLQSSRAVTQNFWWLVMMKMKVWNAGFTAMHVCVRHVYDTEKV